MRLGTTPFVSLRLYSVFAHPIQSGPMKCLRLIIALSLGLTMCGVWADDLPAAASAPGAQSSGSSNATAPAGSAWTAAPRTRKGSADSAPEANGNSSSNTGVNDPSNPDNPNAPAQNLLLQAMS